MIIIRDGFRRFVTKKQQKLVSFKHWTNLEAFD